MIKKLRIQNFRSIKDITLYVSNLNALIGPNSTGKTNILKALDLLLGEAWTTKAKVSREYFNDPAAPIVIEAELKEPVTFRTPSSYKETTVTSVRLELTIEPDVTAKTTINGGNTFYGQEQFKKLCHFIYLPADRNLANELRVSQWTMLGKLMKVIHENYIENYSSDDNLKEAFLEAINPAKKFLEKDFSADPAIVTFKKFVDSFKSNCKANSHGLANDFEPVLNIYNLNWFYKTLQIQVKESLPDKHFDSEDVGAGMQNLLMLSIFQTYAQLMGGRVIFGIEEPEIYLYPQAQRSLYKHFQSISEQSQIFYSTHNPNFVDAARPSDIILLRKSVENGTYPLQKSLYFSAENAEKDWHRIYTQFNKDRNELFFAKKVLLVEGDSDKILIATLCEQHWNIDIDAEGISIISCGGKAGVLYFIGICQLVGINDYFAVWDTDNEVDDRRNILSATLDAKKGIAFDPNMETALSIPAGADAKKIKNAYEWVVNIETEQVPETLDSLRLFLDPNFTITEAVAVINDDDLPF